MTTIDVVKEPTLRIETANIFELLDAPVGGDKAQQMLRIFRNLTGDPQIDPKDAARECRTAFFILDNLSFMDAQDYTNERNKYTTWFNQGRKKLMQAFRDEGERLDPASIT